MVSDPVSAFSDTDALTACNKSSLFVQVPMDVPRPALDMITKFTRNQSLVETNDVTILTTMNVAAKSLGRKYAYATEY